MANRLRFFRILTSNPMSDVSMLVNQLGVPKYEMQRWIELYRLGGIEFLLDPSTILVETEEYRYDIARRRLICLSNICGFTRDKNDRLKKIERN